MTPRGSIYRTSGKQSPIPQPCLARKRTRRISLKNSVTHWLPTLRAVGGTSESPFFYRLAVGGVGCLGDFRDCGHFNIGVGSRRNPWGHGDKRGDDVLEG